MRIRTIKPEFWQSEKMAKASRDARLLFVGLWSMADDSGRTRAASRLLASTLFPYDDDALAQINGWLAELVKIGCVRVYEVDGCHYLDIPKWSEHQKIDKPSKSKLPGFDECSRVIVDDSRKIALDQGSGIREGKGEEVTPPPFELQKAIPPVIDPEEQDITSGPATMLPKVTKPLLGILHLRNIPSIIKRPEDEATWLACLNEVGESILKQAAMQIAKTGEKGWASVVCPIAYQMRAEAIKPPSQPPVADFESVWDYPPGHILHPQTPGSPNAKLAKSNKEK